MQRNAVNPFHIPIVLDEIAPLLSLKDLRQCILVSRTFWSAFVPYAWRNVHFVSLTLQESHDLADFNSPFLLASSRTPAERREFYQHSVQSIKLAAALPFWYRSSSYGLSPTLSCFPNLTQFNFRNQKFIRTDDRLHEEATVIMPAVLTFLQAHTSLTAVDLSFLQVGPDFVDQLQITMEHLSSLRSLVLTLYGELSLLDHLHILEIGQRLEKFHLSTGSSLCAFSKSSNTELEQYNQRMDTIQADGCMIKDLYIDIGHFEIVMADYLKKCPLLERLIIRTLSTVHSAVYMKLAEAMRENCPRLKHLELKAPQMSEFDQANIIAACCPSTKQDIRPGLYSLKTRFSGAPVSIALDAILGHNSTLTSLSICQGKGVSGPGLHQIVTSCVHLRSLAARVVFMDTIPIAMEVIEGEPWRCRSLCTLSLYFSDFCTSPGRLPASMFLNNLYVQVGTLNLLEVLSFRVGRAGWVPTRQLFLDGIVQFHNLKRLRRFGFHKEEASVLKKRHVKIMLEQWPRLEQLAGLLEDFRAYGLAQWLMRKRPDLDLSEFNDGM
ncbi:hypothetical protein BGX27_009382 [Mortierella sp. AM989]|nr:hypothetical protein BGX27_009382 [Mortierella sp. AM989]